MTTRTVSADLVEEEKTLALLQAATRRDGLNPRSFLGLLSHAVEIRAWEQLGLTFVDFIKQARLTPESIEKAMELPIEHETEEEKYRFERTREEVKRLLDSEVGITNHAVNDEGYVRRRLRRDHSKLYEDVVSGVRSAHDAAVEVGIRKKRASIRVDTPDAAIKALLRRFSREELLTALNGNG